MEFTVTYRKPEHSHFLMACSADIIEVFYKSNKIIILYSPIYSDTSAEEMIENAKKLLKEKYE